MIEKFGTLDRKVDEWKNRTNRILDGYSVRVMKAEAAIIDF